MVKSQAKPAPGEIGIDRHVDILHHNAFGNIDPGSQVKFERVKLLGSTGQISILAQVTQGRVYPEP